MASAGCRAYLAVAGGIDVPPVLGSRATYLRGRLGGLGGRALQKGDALPGGSAARGTRSETGRTVPAARRPAYPAERECRVILGPQDDRFTPEGIRAFLEGPYDVTPQADRMGYRLKGPEITHARGHDIVSDGIPLGGIQVPGEAAADRAPGRPPDDRRLHEDRHRDRRGHRRDRPDPARAADPVPASDASRRPTPRAPRRRAWLARAIEG